MSIKDLTAEELLEAVGQNKSTVSGFSEEKKSLRDFIQDYQIIDGKTKVPNYKIYHEYMKLWRPQRAKLSKIEFFRRFNKYFKIHRTKTTRFYLLKRGIFNIDKDNIDDAKRFDERYRKKIQEKQKI